MRGSPKFLGFLYLTFAIIFIFFAIQSIEDTMWNLFTILLMAIAAYDLIKAIHYFRKK